MVSTFAFCRFALLQRIVLQFCRELTDLDWTKSVVNGDHPGQVLRLLEASGVPHLSAQLHPPTDGLWGIATQCCDCTGSLHRIMSLDLSLWPRNPSHLPDTASLMRCRRALTYAPVLAHVFVPHVFVPLSNFYDTLNFCRSHDAQGLFSQAWTWGPCTQAHRCEAWGAGQGRVEA